MSIPLTMPIVSVHIHVWSPIRVPFLVRVHLHDRVRVYVHVQYSCLCYFSFFMFMLVLMFILMFMFMCMLTLMLMLMFIKRFRSISSGFSFKNQCNVYFNVDITKFFFVCDKPLATYSKGSKKSWYILTKCGISVSLP
jgi:hypothetical protein